MTVHSGISRNGQLYLLRIEIDGHFHGGPPVKPWVAEIGQPCPRYGLERRFLKPMRDWASAHVAWSGNTYGVIATYPLREGKLYEVMRCEGSSSKRHTVRFFVAINGGKQRRLTPIEALARADGGSDAAILTVREPSEPGSTSVARVRALGVVEPQGYVLVDGARHYRVRERAVYAVREENRCRLIGVRAGSIVTLSETEAWTWLT